jgi:hypothetical protein
VGRVRAEVVRVHFLGDTPENTLDNADDPACKAADDPADEVALCWPSRLVLYTNT